jgi:ribonuclease Z
VKITAFEVDHTPVHPAFGYRIDYAGRSVVLSGDTRLSEKLSATPRV